MTANPAKRFVGASVAASLTFGSASAAVAAPAVDAQASPWAVLAVMNGGATAATLCGAAAMAAQAQAPNGCVLPALDPTVPIAQAAPPPAAPVPPISAPAGFGLGVNPLLLGLLAIAAGVGLYFAVRHHGNKPANSPA